jgi:hypothetical protein
MLRFLSFGAAMAALVLAGCGDPTSLESEPGGTGGTDVEPGPTCIAFCARTVGDCGVFTFTEAVCRDSCQLSLDAEYEQAEACGMAAEDVFICATGLDCEEIPDWLDKTPGGYPCQPEVEAFDQLIRDGVCLPE